MLKFTLFFLLIPSVGFNQIIPSATDTSIRIVALPPLEKTKFRSLKEVGRFSHYQYVITSDSLYYQIFSSYHRDSLPLINFSTHELVANISCVYCSGNKYGDNTPKHRNACRYFSVWVVRRKSIGQSAVNSRSVGSQSVDSRQLTVNQSTVNQSSVTNQLINYSTNNFSFSTNSFLSIILAPNPARYSVYTWQSISSMPSVFNCCIYLMNA